MEERIIEATEYLLMALNDIKDYKDFINYKTEMIIAINDIIKIIRNYKNIDYIKNNDKNSKISSILGLQFNYDSLINENDAKFFSDYEEKYNKVKNKINSYFKNSVDTHIMKDKYNENEKMTPDEALNYTESLRNKNKLSQIKEKNKNKCVIENLKKRKKGKKDIESIIKKMNNNDYIYDILIKIFGYNIKDKLLSNKVNDSLIEDVQNAIIEIEKKFKNNNKNSNKNIKEKVEKLYKEKFDNSQINTNKINDLEKSNINNYMSNDLNKKNKKLKRYKSFNNYKIFEQYQEFNNFKNKYRNKSPNNFYINKYNTNFNEQVNKNNLIEDKFKINKKRGYPKKPFINATCGYGKYFDEGLQKGGVSKLDNKNN